MTEQFVLTQIAYSPNTAPKYERDHTHNAAPSMNQTAAAYFPLSTILMSPRETINLQCCRWVRDAGTKRQIG